MFSIIDKPNVSIENPGTICRFAANWPVLTDAREKVMTVKRRGIQNYLQKSEYRNDDDLCSHIQDQESITVHRKCNFKYIKSRIVVAKSNKRPIDDPSDDDDQSSDTEENSDQFYFADNCLICFKKIFDRHGKRARRCLTNETKESIIEYIQNNQNLSEKFTNFP